MKILVVCFSLTGKTELIARKLAKSLEADYAALQPVKWKSRFAAYTVGLFLAQRHKEVELLPLEDVDVASYDCVVVAGPIWGGAPAPMLNGFIRQYQLEGKQTYGLLSCGLEGKSASKLLREELEAAGTRCRSVITVKAEEETLEALEKGKIEFLMKEKGKIILQVSEKHRKKKNLTEDQVQEMRDLIDASETDDSVKKKAPQPEEAVSAGEPEKAEAAAEETQPAMEAVEEEAASASPDEPEAREKETRPEPAESQEPAAAENGPEEAEPTPQPGPETTESTAEAQAQPEEPMGQEDEPAEKAGPSETKAPAETEEAPKKTRKGRKRNEEPNRNN